MGTPRFKRRQVTTRENEDQQEQPESADAVPSTELAVVESGTKETVLEGKKKKARPFVKWAGGKTTLLPQIQARVPKEYNRLYEPFVGGGAVFFKLAPKLAHINDINDELINTYKVVRNKVEELIDALARHRYEKEYYYRLRSADREANFKYWTDVQRASRFIYLNKTCYNGLYRLNSKGQFNTPFGKYKDPKILDTDNLRACSRALANTRISKSSFEQVAGAAEAGDFVYFDPPYAPLSKTSNFTSYSSDGFALDEHEKLRDVCRELDKKGIPFLLSNSSADAVREIFAEFRIEEVQAPRFINSKAKKRGQIIELLVSNYL